MSLSFSVRVSVAWGGGGVSRKESKRVFVPVDLLALTL